MTARVALITGAGHGIGRATALALAAAGQSVIVNDLDPDRAAAVAAEIESAGGRAEAVAADIADRTEVARLVDAALARFGRLDAILHSAALIRRLPLVDLTPDLLDRFLRTNLAAAYHLIQLAWPHLAAAGSARIVLLGSGAGMFGLSGQSAYGGTKSGLRGLCRAVAEEGAAAGLTCNIVQPYAVTNPGRTKLDWPAEDLALVNERGVEYLTPLLEHLLSPECTTTGEIISAMGGRYSRVVVAQTDGWVSPVPPTSADIAAHWGRILDPARLSIPATFVDELTQTAAAIRARSENPPTR